MAEEMATATVGTHHTKMHSCAKIPSNFCAQFSPAKGNYERGECDISLL